MKSFLKLVSVLVTFGISFVFGSSSLSAGEAPELAAQVKAGTLPPLNERLPEIPLMLPVEDEIGQYGGTLRRAFLGPGDHNNYTRAVYDALVRYAPDGSQIVPHIAAGWESNYNFTEWIIRLRAGAKWSDGQPFTADDILFWYEDMLMNKDLMPGGVNWMKNEDGSMAKGKDLFNFAKKHKLKIGKIKDLISYRLKKEKLIRLKKSSEIKVKNQDYKIKIYENLLDGSENFALIKGSIKKGVTPRVRVISSNIVYNYLINQKIPISFNKTLNYFKRFNNCVLVFINDSNLKPTFQKLKKK